MFYNGTWTSMRGKLVIRGNEKVWERLAIGLAKLLTQLFPS